MAVVLLMGPEYRYIDYISGASQRRINKYIGVYTHIFWG